MTRIFLVAIAAVAYLVAACGGEEVSPTETPSPRDGQPKASATPSPPPGDGQPAPPEGRSVEFETIETGQSSGVGEGERLFKIETQSEWEEFWARHKSNAMPAPDLPSVDFSREMVIAAVDQVEVSGGIQFEVADIVQDGDSVTVLVNKAVPGPDCAVTAVLTQPFHIVRLAKSSALPELLVTEETYSCG